MQIRSKSHVCFEKRCAKNGATSLSYGLVCTLVLFTKRAIHHEAG